MDKLNFEYSRPESLGISPKTIGRFIDMSNKEINSLYSFTILKGMTIACQGYANPMEADDNKIMHSIAKSVNSLAIGIAIGDGKLHLDDYLVDFFKDEMPKEYDERIKDVRVRNLLMMAANSAFTSASFINVEGNWRTHYLGLKLPDEPGNSFSYDTGASYMLSCLITKVMGKNSHELVKERIFNHIGINDSYWLTDKDGNSLGGWGLYLKAEDMVKLGRLILNYGSWEGKQLIPKWYMGQATSKKISTYNNPGMGWPYGYGFQFWIWPEKTFGCFGAFGQLIVCSPEKDIVVTTTAGCNYEENKRLAMIIIETIISESENDPLPMDDDSYKSLLKKIDNWQLPTAAGKVFSLKEKNILERQYTFEDNIYHINNIKITRIDKNTLEITMVYKGRQIIFNAAYNKWITTEAELDTPMHRFHSFTYGWKDENILELKQYIKNSSYYKIYTLIFKDNSMTLSIKQNISLYGDKADIVEGVL